LVHPGDSFSYDIFSQAGEAIRQPSGPNPLADLRLKTVIATGESQSAFRMVTYIDAIHPVARVYDGFLVHSRASTGVPLSEAPQPVIPVPSPTVIRSDLDVPVLTFQTETDLLFLQSLAARQDDTDRLRLWEVAGTSPACSSAPPPPSTRARSPRSTPPTAPIPRRSTGRRGAPCGRAS